MRAAITGGTGFVGRRLLERLPGAVVLTRNPDRAVGLPDSVRVLGWDPMREPAPVEAFEGIEAVFHLAGENVGARWTRRRRRLIEQSREIGTRHLVAGMAGLSDRPRVLVSASAVGYYGDRGNRVLSEQATAGDDYLARVCVTWEQEARQAERWGVRTVCSRTGLVVGRGGGPLARMLPLFKLGLGGPLGSGRQWWPWVHLDDVIEGLLFAAGNEAVSGPMNLVSPAPATNRIFTLALGRVLRRPALLQVPAPVLRLALGQMASMLLASQRAVPVALQEAGYSFVRPDLVAALHDVTGYPAVHPGAAGGKGRRN
jgi:uncharacterized protein